LVVTTSARGGEGEEGAGGVGKLTNTQRGAANSASWRVQHDIVASWVFVPNSGNTGRIGGGGEGRGEGGEGREERWDKGGR
jgi:hypothetical protein